MTVQEYITFISKYPGYGDPEYLQIYTWLRTYLSSGDVQAVVKYNMFGDLRKVIALGFLADFAPLQEHHSSTSKPVVAGAWFIDSVWFDRIKSQLGFWRNPSTLIHNVGDSVPRPLSISAAAAGSGSARRLAPHPMAAVGPPGPVASGSLAAGSQAGPDCGTAAAAVSSPESSAVIVDAAPVHPRISAMVSGSDADIKRRVDVLRRLEVPVVGYLESEISAARKANTQEASSFLPGTSTLNVKVNDWAFILWNDKSVPDFLKSHPADIVRPAGSSSSALVHPEMKDIILARCVKVSYDTSEWDDLRTSVIEDNANARTANMKRTTKSKAEIVTRTRAIAEKSEEEKKEMDVDGWKTKQLDSSPDLYVIVVEYWRRKGKGDERVTDVTTDNFWGPFVPDVINIRANTLSSMTLEKGLVAVDNVFCIVPLNKEKPYNPRTNTITITAAIKKQLCCLPSRGGYFPHFGAGSVEGVRPGPVAPVNIADPPAANSEAPSEQIDSEPESSPTDSSDSESSDSTSDSDSDYDSDINLDRPLRPAAAVAPRRARRSLPDHPSSMTVVADAASHDQTAPATIRRRKVSVRTAPDQPISAPLADVVHPEFDGPTQRIPNRADHGIAAQVSRRVVSDSAAPTRSTATVATATEIMQSYTAALSNVSPAIETESKKRNIPGSSIAAHRFRRQETHRPGTGAPPTEKKSSNTVRTVARVPKGYGVTHSSLSSVPPPPFDHQISRAQGTYVVVEPTVDEVEEYGDRFWVGKLVEDGPERGFFSVKWMKSWNTRKVEGLAPEFGKYLIWKNDIVRIRAKDVKYAFGELSAKNKLRKKDEDAIRGLFSIERS